MKHRLLITGINGFTGLHLEPFLASMGFEVFGTVVGEPGKPNHFRCDIRSKEEVRRVVEAVKPDYVLHTAAISFVGESDASRIYDVNVIGTENLLEALAQQEKKPGKVVLASSATVYGNQGHEVLDESMCPRPVNHYGCSKLAMEHMASNYFDRLDIIVTRPFNYTGVHQAKHFLIPKIVDHYKRGAASIELGNLDVSREFNDVRDVSEIYHRLLLCDAKSTVVNLCSENAIKLLDVIEAMNKIAGYEMEVKVNPAFVRANEIKVLKGSKGRLASMIDLSFSHSMSDTLLEIFEN